MLSFSARFAFAFAPLALAACGGRVVVDGASGSGGAGGSPSTASSSSQASSAGTGAACDGRPPAIGAPCATEGATCPLIDACCGANAVCKGGFWVFGGPLCNMVCGPACGPSGLSCTTTALCVEEEGDALITYQCKDDPCPGAESCACLASLCDGLTCTDVKSPFLLCTCPNC